jgi:integrase
MTLGFKEPKTERRKRTIALAGLSVEALRRHRARQAELRLKIGPVYTDHDLVCCQAHGEPLSPRAVSKAFSVVAKNRGLKLRFHDLRHSHLSHLLAAGVHPKVASGRAAHAYVSITLHVYSHVGHAGRCSEKDRCRLAGSSQKAASRFDPTRGLRQTA